MNWILKTFPAQAPWQLLLGNTYVRANLVDKQTEAKIENKQLIKKSLF